AHLAEDDSSCFDYECVTRLVGKQALSLNGSKGVLLKERQSLLDTGTFAHDQIFEAAVVHFLASCRWDLDGIGRGHVEEQALVVHAPLRKAVQIIRLNFGDVSLWDVQLVMRNPAFWIFTAAKAEIHNSVIVFGCGNEPQLSVGIGPVFVVARKGQFAIEGKE